VAAAAAPPQGPKADVPLHRGGAKGGSAGPGTYGKPPRGKGKAAVEGKGSKRVGLSILQKSRDWKGPPEII